jgi:hypothetical protein
MNKKFGVFWGNIVYSIIVIPSFIYFIINDSNNQFAALFIAALAFPWSFILAFILGALGIDISSKLAIRSLMLLLFVLLNQIIIGYFFIRKRQY